MNYNPLIRDRIAEFKVSSPDFTFCHMVLSALRQIKRDFSQEDLLDITDEEVYTALGKSIKIEEE